MSASIVCSGTTFNRPSAWGVEVSLDPQQVAMTDDRLHEVDRRLTAITLGGYRAVPNIETNSHRRAVATLRGQGHVTASQLSTSWLPLRLLPPTVPATRPAPTVPDMRATMPAHCWPATSTCMPPAMSFNVRVGDSWSIRSGPRGTGT